VTIGQAWRSIRDRLRAAGLSNPEVDARRIAEMTFRLWGLDLIANEREVAKKSTLKRLEALAQRRLSGEPLARILGEQEFYGLVFKLNAHTLVPRPETEMLVDFALANLAPDQPSRILDLGTGTGCIALSILAHLPHATAVGVDVSPEAVACATANAEALDLAPRFEARAGYWYKPVKRDDRFDLIVSNPPYVRTGDIGSLMPEVREHDPKAALDGGLDGLNAHRAVAFTARNFVKPGGLIALECGAGQGESVATILKTGGFSEIAIKKDLAGLDRVVHGHHLKAEG
jgi:release factor glutamine methyltransferase